MTPQKRIKEERERLGMSQLEFARLGNATKQSQFNWEKGTAYPNLAVLAAWAHSSAKVDVVYILTGIRASFMNTLDAIKSASDIAAKMDLSTEKKNVLQELLLNTLVRDVPVLNKDEQSLLLAYREATNDTKKAICRILDIKD